jgi:tripartite-type tricarboxylate transporter receptor subunit TctC
LFAPAGTPPAIVAKWNGDVAKILNSPDVRAKLIADGADPSPDTPEQFAQMIARELAKYARIVKLSGAKVD